MMFNIIILIFIGCNTAFTLFDLVWFLVALKAQGFSTAACLFLIASILHTYMIVAAWERLKSLDPAKDEEQ